ncbi:MAG TPA: KTSC domain-containing protein [Lysobacter sp.]|nr:KTSC domain-containing protein [Lysobacter sp.]
MKRVPVESEAMRGVGYDGPRRVLEIEFVDHGVYDYFDVPPSVHRALMRAESHGRYFAGHIRDRYAYERIGAG